MSDNRAATEFDRLQVQMAAKGCVSGTLAEWPYLAGALRRYGFDLPPETEARHLRDLSREILDGSLAEAK